MFVQPTVRIRSSAISTRLMVSLRYLNLKYMHNLSDEDVLSGWVENPYWQYLGGMKFFSMASIDPSSMTGGAIASEKRERKNC